MIKTLRPMNWLAGLALLMAGLSGCAGFTSAVDDEQARCPDVTPPDHPQPFDAAARRQLQRLTAHSADNETVPKNTAFIRLDEQGIALANPHPVYDREPWACVTDKRTALTWEVKTNDRSLRDTHWTYTWYAPSLAGAYGYAGKADGGNCLEDPSLENRLPDAVSCDTQAYVDAVNATRLCGHDDWRLPQAFELHSLLEPGKNCPGTCIDQGYFPNTASGGYWSSSPFDGFACYAWGVDFELGGASGANKNTPLHVRLVRGKWLIPAAASE